jgi:hypothetical protein
VESTDIDYAESGLTVQQAMVAHALQHPNKERRPVTIRWGDRIVRTSDRICVPREGIVRVEFLSPTRAIRQGVDLELNGWIELSVKEHVSILRTWQDDRFEDVVEYPYLSQDGLMWTWNVYEMVYPGGQKVVEKWTENACFWVEDHGDIERVYHCSNGMATPPDYNSLIYKVTIKPR